MLISDDHILVDITPNIALGPVLPNSLEKYLESLDKVKSMDVKLVLPGHRRIFRNLTGRIEELKEHHRKRLLEALSSLGAPKTAWNVAPHITWDIKFQSWDGMEFHYNRSGLPWEKP